MSENLVFHTHPKKTMLFSQRFNIVNFLVCLFFSILISILAGYKPVSSITPPWSVTQLAHSGTIVDVVSTNGSFHTLVNALKAADLTEMLNSKDRYTIFAPTDAAFKLLPQGTLDKLLNQANKATLKKILTYHIVKDSIGSRNLKSGSLKTLEGNPVDIKVYSGRIKVNTAEVITPNIKASNGFIHAINKVIIPPDLKL